MRQKIEIKVYLPYMMVGELESLKRRGMRSKFIEDAIRTKLDGQEAFRPQDLPTRRVIALLLARYPDDDVLRTILLDRMPPLEGVE
jgi:metal-responsive CopG/Arc/MetJ family transcriptional regulator